MAAAGKERHDHSTFDRSHLTDSGQLGIVTSHMSFNSYEFLFAFLPVVVFGFWLLLKLKERSWATAWLLLTSVVFYLATSPLALALIVPSILLDFLIAQILLRVDVSRQTLRNIWFTLGIAANLLFLGYFKYTNFLLQTSNTILGTHWQFASLILPLGISFLTFQKLAFLADVKSGLIQSVRFPEFLLFTLFFPRTVAGPIIHYQELIPQIRSVRQTGCAVHIALGLCLLSIGLFKKALIADNLNPFAAAVFDPPSVVTDIPDLPHTLLVSWVGLLAYALQLYFDFSGYSDMALGVARMVGVRLPMNFNSPFKATNIVEFWSRWHITLTRFLTAYIYTPIVLHLTRKRMQEGKAVLSGRRSKPSAIASLVALPSLVTMGISGLWHGAGWQFVVWGLLHGIYLTVNQGWRILRPRRADGPERYRWLARTSSQTLTFTLVVIALVFFRSSTLPAALSVFKGLAGINGVLPHVEQMLNGAGVDLNMAFLETELPLEGAWWIATLLPAVMLLPNSLELMQRFDPALDFERTGTGGARAMDFSTATATVAALLILLSVMSLSHSGGFVYGRF